MDMMAVTTVNHGTYEAPAVTVSGLMCAYAGKGVRELRIDWCDMTGTAEWVWDDITERSTWLVMLATKVALPLVASARSGLRRSY